VLAAAGVVGGALTTVIGAEAYDVVDPSESVPVMRRMISSPRLNSVLSIWFPLLTWLPLTRHV
jgi:hypothetical protein